MIRIDRVHPDYWRVRSFCACGQLARATVAATLRAAVWRFRLERREMRDVA